MEKHILALEAAGYNGEVSLEDHALELAIEETYENTGRKWKPWAKNARALRVGEIILIVDSDTIVPEVSQAPRSCSTDHQLMYHLSPSQPCHLSDYRIALGTLHVN